MKDPRTWLEQESPRWTQAGLVTAEQAAGIRALYPPRAAPPWGLIVFCGLGAVIVGLGIALLIAYNWDAIPKFGKLGLVFAGLLGAHGAALRLRAQGGWQANLGEALALLGTMLFGAGIWLVAQVYHIDEHFPNGFLFWGLGALALAWALDSVPQALLAVVVLTIWGCVEVFNFRTSLDASWLVVAAGAGALAWRKRSALLLAVVLAALYVLILSNAGFWSEGSGVYFAALGLSVSLLAVRHLAGAGRFGVAGERVLSFYGFAGFLFCAFLMTFKHAASDILRWSAPDGAGLGLWFYRWLLPVLALVAWLVLLGRALATRNWKAVPREEWLAPLALVYATGLSAIGGWRDYEFLSLVFNLVVLTIAAAWMLRGCRDGELRPTILGSLLLSAVVFARYFDLFDNLAVRGVAFLVLGGLLFAEGFYYRKLRQAERTSEGGAS